RIIYSCRPGGRNRMLFLKPRRRLFATVALIAVVWLAIGGAKTVQAVARESYENLEVFTNILAIVQQNYVDPVSTKQLIEGEFTKDMSLVEAMKKMRALKGTKVMLTLRREGVPELFDVAVTREIIQIQSVKSRPLEKGYGYVRVTQFQERTDEDLEKAVDRMAKQGGSKLEGLVLDLRNNPGGLLTQTVGKGSVQTILPLGDNSALRLTTARYYTPRGRSIQATGITPDIIMGNEVASVKSPGAPGEGGDFLREENLRGHFNNPPMPQ